MSKEITDKLRGNAPDLNDAKFAKDVADRMDAIESENAEMRGGFLKAYGTTHPEAYRISVVQARNQGRREAADICTAMGLTDAATAILANLQPEVESNG